MSVDSAFARLISRNPKEAVVKQDSPEENAAEMEEMRRKAFLEAEQKVKEEQKEERKKQRELFSNMESSFCEFLDSVEAEVSRQLIDFSLRLAEIIIRHEPTHCAMIKQVVRETLEPLSDLHGASVHLCPADADIVRAAGEDGKHPDICDRIEIVPDTSLGPGDVRIESRNGYFDGRISARVELLKERLTEQLRSKHADSGTS